MPDFLLPDLGEGLEDAEIVAWHVQVGDRVEIDQIVVEVETAKALVAVPIPFAGVVSARHAEPGGTVSVGRPLVSVVAGAAEPQGFHEPGVVTPGPEPSGDAEESSGNVLIGYGTTTVPRRPRGRRPGRARRPAHRTATAPALATASGTVPASGSASGTEPSRPASTVTPLPAPSTAPGPVAEDHRVSADGHTGIRGGPVRVISPVVRKLARDAGLDLTRITGSGPAGLIRRCDVEQALATAAPDVEIPARPATGIPGDNGTAGVARAPRSARGAVPGPGSPETGSPTRIPIRGVRKTIAEKLSRSRREIPEATVWVDVDATELMAVRDALNARDPRRPVSVTALLARFALLGLRRHPELNARIEQDEIVMLDHVNLGFAAQTDRGLFVPVVHDAHRLPLRDLSGAIARHTEAARSGDLTPAELTGGTITVNNYGVFGVDGSAAIINHPEAAILGIGRIIDRPWVVDGELTVRKIAELTLAFDHRVCDGGTAGGFLRYVADCVESPLLTLGDL